MSSAIDVSIIIVSFNTRDLLRECLLAVRRQAGPTVEVLVADNASQDGSAEMVGREFPEARLRQHADNLGFAAAVNRVAAQASGRYLMLLNPDAVMSHGALAQAVKHMEEHPAVAVGGARLFGSDNTPLPSARSFPSPLNDLLTLSGLAQRYPHSRLFGRPDRTWADPLRAAAVDWVPGAFAIIRRAVWSELGGFDERFFLYFEEIDFCRRVRQAGWQVCYWPEITVRHVGGAAAHALAGLSISTRGHQVNLWRIRSALLYHRKHHGAAGAWLARLIEAGWHSLRARRHAGGAAPEAVAKAQESRALCELWRRAWRETQGGRSAPPTPW